ncbi:MAG: metallopeptidase family protein [Acidobacteria bacterium]|nr:metallopeptidase family protein [Acidobacteriota bacterium]
MSPAEFDRIVERAVAAVPSPYRQRVQNLVIVVEAEPPRPNLLGLYQGRPLTQRGVSDQFQMPDTITIYQGPHERMARSYEHLVELVKETVWHEIAHYFGLNEAEVLRAERRRARFRRLGRG